MNWQNMSAHIFCWATDPSEYEGWSVWPGRSGRLPASAARAPSPTPRSDAETPTSASRPLWTCLTAEGFFNAAAVGSERKAPADMELTSQTRWRWSSPDRVSTHKPAEQIHSGSITAQYTLKRWNLKKYDSETTEQIANNNLEQVDVGVDHGVAEVGLDVGHRLSLDLQTVPDPHVVVDLWQTGLHNTHTHVTVDRTSRLLSQ